MSYQERLERAAELWGIEKEYWDVWGTLHRTAPETEVAILHALGVPTGSEEELEKATVNRLCEEWSRLTPPALVMSPETAEFPVSAPAGLNGELSVHILWEQGGEAAYSVALGAMPVVETGEAGGCKYERRMAPLPAGLPLGYHELCVSGGGQTSVTRLIVGPDRAWLPEGLAAGGRAAGIAVSLYGLRSSRNWGCGDLTDLERIAEWAAAELGASFIGLNPLHAISNRQPFNTSPYLPNSVFYRNLIYIDVERLEDFQASRNARALFADPAVQQEVASLRDAPLVEYERVHALKLRFLKLCFETFFTGALGDAASARRFEAYCEKEGRLLDLFALHSALDAWMHERDPRIWTWGQWPEEYQHPDSEAVRLFAAEHAKDVLFYKYIQWRFDEQLEAVQRHAAGAGLTIGLYHDLALATDRWGADCWAHREFFAGNCSVGAPPDDFCPKGQDWGFPPPNSGRHRRDGYRLFAESIRHNMRRGGALRIDHVMRFFRLFWIPEGMDAAQGAYVRDLHQDLLRIVTLESVRNRVMIIGEDLGTVAPEVRHTLERFGILSYRLLYFERRPDGAFRQPGEYPRQALASSTTHDLPTLAGFWVGRDIEVRYQAGLLDSLEACRAQWAQRARDKQRLLDALFQAGLLPDWFPRDAAVIPELTGELHNAIVGYLALTPSMLMLVNEEDLTKETEQQNLPGATWQYPNWRRKMRFAVEELTSLPQAADFAAMFRNWVRRSQRTLPFYG